MHACQLVSHEAGGVGLKGEGDQIEHGVNEFVGSLVVGIEAKTLGIHFGSGHVQPLRGPFHVPFDLTHGGEILIELVLIRFRQLSVHGFRIVQQEVQMAPGSGEPLSLGVNGFSV